MHELAITQSILNIALEQAAAARAGKVTRINLTIGELSGFVDESIEFHFGFLSRDTIAAGAALSFDKPTARLRCRKCQKEFSPEESLWVCPSCLEPGAEVVSGRECYVSSIEVE